MNIKYFFKIVLFSIGTLGIFLFISTSCKKEKKKVSTGPNILILMSDNHSWNHLRCYGDPVVRTPNIDELSSQGVRFTHAFCSAPSCTPARASMLTGQDFFRLEEGANLWGKLPDKFAVYTDILEENGYRVGYEGKGWGPGNYEAGGWNQNPAGERFYSFEEFLNKRKNGEPFCFWFSSREPHRPFRTGGYKDLGTEVENIEVPPYLPDQLEVKKDIGDYYAVIEDFDKEVGSFIELLEEKGELDNTLVIVCSDNGWQMPRGLTNLYDFGTRIPLIVSMPTRYKSARVIDDFVSLNDFAPTFLKLAGIDIPAEMNARSFLNILESENEGIVDSSRDFIVTGRERHAFVRKDGAGYGARALRTSDFLYIRNYEPDAWPQGDPPLYGDIDSPRLDYPCPTKMYMLTNRKKNSVKELFELAFEKRPAEELYDLKKDPWQMNNVAYDETYKEKKKTLANQLTKYLKENGDPRETDAEMKWIGAKYFNEKGKSAKPGVEAREALNLKEEYTYTEE